MAVLSILRRRPARRTATRIVATAVVAAVAAAGLATTAAAQGRYTDVDSAHHGANIEALEEAGVFDGTECGARKFCPDDPAKRWAVAVWIVRVIDGADPFPVKESRFVDVDDDEWWMPYVERLADLQITVGCKTNPLRFCPDQTVTRARMASFLVRAFRLQRAPSAGFTDTRGSVHKANIDALFAAGITAGCKTNPLRYCPDSPVSRAQMASLLNRGLGEATSVGTGGGTGGTSGGTGGGPEQVAEPVEEPGGGTSGGTAPGSITLDVEPRSGDTLIAATRGRTCAVRTSDTVTCWGGDEGYLEHLSASGLDDVMALSTGNHDTAGLHTCAVHDNGDVSCWGPGSQGQLGLGDTEHLPPAGVGSRHLRRGGSGGGAVLSPASSTTDGDVSCWGLNSLGQLGDDTSVSNRDWPARVPGLVDIVAISAGENHVCAIDDDGDLSCWGWVYGDTPIDGEGPE